MSPSQHPSLSRRSLLLALSGCLLSQGLEPLFAADAPSTAPHDWPGALPLNWEIVDTHQHLWRHGWLSRLLTPGHSPSPPWLKGAPPILQKTFWVREYETAAAGLPLRALYMEVDVDEADLDLEMASIRQVCANPKGRTLGAVGGGRPESPGFGEYLKKHREWSGLKGIRRVLHPSTLKSGFCRERTFVSGIRKLGELGLTFDVCIRVGDLGDALYLAEACPDTTLILDHCGSGDAKAFQKRPASKPAHAAATWQRTIERLSKKKNVACKISGVVESLPNGWEVEDLAPVVRHCLDAFGPDRVVFGTNWPVCLIGATAAQWIHALGTLIADRPEAERRKLWSQNARRIYRL